MLLTEHNFFVNVTDVLKCSVVEDDMKITDELRSPTTVDECAMKCSNWKKDLHRFYIKFYCYFLFDIRVLFAY